MLGGGSYEIYLAPSTTTPTPACSIDVQTGRLSFANLTYDRRPEYTAIKTDRPDLYRREHQVLRRPSGDLCLSSPGRHGYVLPHRRLGMGVRKRALGQERQLRLERHRIHPRPLHLGKARVRPARIRAQAILRHRIFTAFAAYKAEKATRAEHAGILDFWQDPVLGNPEFYKVRVKPLVEKLNALEALVKPGMSDEETSPVAAGTLQGWTNIRYTVDHSPGFSWPSRPSGTVQSCRALPSVENRMKIWSLGGGYWPSLRHHCGEEPQTQSSSLERSTGPRA